jgi:hypothetical protein
MRRERTCRTGRPIWLKTVSCVAASSKIVSNSKVRSLCSLSVPPGVTERTAAGRRESVVPVASATALSSSFSSGRNRTDTWMRSVVPSSGVASAVAWAERRLDFVLIGPPLPSGAHKQT